MSELDRIHLIHLIQSTGMQHYTTVQMYPDVMVAAEKSYCLYLFAL